ncbi:MAG: phosphopantetheine-binding protein, partial [Bacteroidota bacterium]|nr:phosphopantetheine-binding protein [Bacteroidota bacterium]
VPQQWIELEQLPLTSNGKVDRRALPELDTSELSSQAYVAPRTPTEEKLVEIWQELLGVDRVGIYDNFFELGGHSLLATKVMSKIRKEMKVELEIDDMFQFTTINRLSKFLEIQCENYLQKEDSTEFELLNI